MFIFRSRFKAVVAITLIASTVYLYIWMHKKRPQNSKSSKNVTSPNTIAPPSAIVVTPENGEAVVQIGRFLELPDSDIKILDLDTGIYRVSDGRKSSLKQELKQIHAAPMLINVWASWCAPCLEELPRLQELYENKHLHILGIIRDLRTKAAHERIEKIIQANRITYPQFFEDATGKITSTIFQAADLELPSSALFNSSGFLRIRITGPISNVNLYKKLTASMERLQGN